MITSDDIIKRIKVWRKRPDLFVADWWPGINFDPQQLAILDSVSTQGFTAGKSGHGVGKTATESIAVLWFLMCFTDCRVAVTAPTEDQITKMFWPEISKWLLKSDLQYYITWTKSKVFVNGEEETAFAVYRTATKPEALQGFHAKNILFILEEASGIEDAIWEPIEGALTSGNAKALALGNPTRPEGNFYRAFTDQAEFWNTLTMSCIDSTLVNTDYPIRMAKKYGIDSDVYRVRVLGEFPSQVSDAFIPLYICENSLKLELPHNPVNRMGVDVARYGDDYTVWLIRAGGNIVHAERKQTMSTMEIVGSIIRLAREYNIAPENIFVDVVGVGAGVCDRLIELGFAVNEVNNASSPTDEENYINKRVELWGIVKQELVNKLLNLKIQNDSDMTRELTGELASPKYKYTSKGQYQLESKDDMKKRGVGSPDIADALTMTYFYSDGNSSTIRSGGNIAYPK